MNLKICLLAFLFFASKAQIFKVGYNKDSILNKSQGFRPDPKLYLDSVYLVSHLAKFTTGGAFLIPQKILDKFGREVLGRKDGQFVMSKTEMDSLLIKCENKISLIETELGIPPGVWQDQVILRIDVPNLILFNLRLPNGNETAANGMWLPGGLLPNGYSEAVVDQIPRGLYIETILNLH